MLKRRHRHRRLLRYLTQSNSFTVGQRSRRFCLSPRQSQIVKCSSRREYGCSTRPAASTLRKCSRSPFASFLTPAFAAHLFPYTLVLPVRQALVAPLAPGDWRDRVSLPLRVLIINASALIPKCLACHSRVRAESDRVYGAAPPDQPISAQPQLRMAGMAWGA
jgi:hypothetical protein